VNFVSRRRQIFALQHRTDVVGDDQCHLLTKHLGDLRTGVFVARVDQWELVGGAKARARLGRRDILRHFDHVRDGAPIGSPRHQNHVRPHGANTLDLFVREPSVVGGQHVDDDGPGAQRGPLRALPGHALHYAGHHHLQTAASTAGRDVNVDAGLGVPLRRAIRDDEPVPVEHLPAGEFFDFGDRVQHAAGHVLKRRFHRRRGFAATGLAILVADLLDENGFGRRAAAVGGNDDVERMIDLRLVRTVGRGAH